MKKAHVLMAALAGLSIFVSGTVLAQEKKAGAPAGKAAAGKTDPTGTWTWKTEGRDGQSFESTAKLKLEGDKVTGTVLGRNGNESAVTDGKLAKNEIVFAITRERNDGTKMVSKFNGKLEGDTIKGTIVTNRNGEDQTRPWEATRAKEAK